MTVQKWIEERVEQVRQARKQQGHDLSHLQQGIVESLVAWDPAHDAVSRRELTSIEDAIEADGHWEAEEEWRISTWFTSSITRSAKNGAPVYEVSVECDGQRLACACPTLEGAYAFMHLYQSFIVDQFYSVGPPWAAKGF